MRSHDYWVYVLASGPCGWLYIGMTNDLVRRVGEHKSGHFDSYTREHGIDQLVWFEHHQFVDQAILREKRIKRWLRPWKFALVEECNPRWLDLYGEVVAARLPAQPKRAVRDD
jgi:putative endonuclease